MALDILALAYHILALVHTTLAMTHPVLTLLVHPGYTLPAALVGAASAAAHREAGTRLAMGLGIEPFTHQP